MNKIQIDVGVYTPLYVDLTNYDFNGITKLILTIKNYLDDDAEKIIVREFTEPNEYEVLITPEESRKLLDSAVYDFVFETLDGKTYKTTDVGRIDLHKVVGEVDE